MKSKYFFVDVFSDVQSAVETTNEYESSSVIDNDLYMILFISGIISNFTNLGESAPNSEE